MAKNRNAMWDEISRRKLEPIMLEDLLKRIGKGPHYVDLLNRGVFIPVGQAPDSRLYPVADIERRGAGNYQVDGLGDKYGGWEVDGNCTLYIDPVIVTPHVHESVKVERADGKKFYCAKCDQYWVAKPKKDAYCYEIPTFRNGFKGIAEHLVTESKLKKLKLQPGEIRGIVFYAAGRESTWVYDVREATPAAAKLPKPVRTYPLVAVPLPSHAAIKPIPAPVAAKPDYCCPGCGRAVSREEKLFGMEDGRCKACRKT